jgi:maleate isomerase
MTAMAGAGAAYGWRGRIGFLQPAMANPNHPHEFYLIVPEGVTISIASLRSYGDPEGGEFLNPESLRLPMSRIPQGTKVLIAQGVDVVVQAGVPHTTVEGWGYESRLRAEVREITDVPFVIDTHSSIDAMKTLGMSRVLMVSPFPEKSSAHVIEYVSHAGIEVVHAHRVMVSEYGGLYGITLGAVYQEAKKAYRGVGKVDGIWLPGAAMPSVAAIDPLERDLGVPVVSSKQAMIWAALREARVECTIGGYGSLFQAAE